MNVVLIVVDSLRKRSLQPARPTSPASPDQRPATPFLERLAHETISFERAYATECWTLPTHMSMFTGLLPSEHGAHFQSMRYAGTAPTLAELLASAGHHTEFITRNSIFDSSLPGVTRGFAVERRPLAPLPKGLSPLLLVLALAKPRVRRLIRTSGFFGRRQKASAEFLVTLARMGIPADRLALEQALETMESCRRKAKPYFVFVNLYDVHAPYCPSEASPLRPLDSPRALLENLSLARVLPKVSSHAYLRPGFRMAERSRRMLLGRYHRAIELMDGKLEWFHGEARSRGLLDDTLLVVTSDHGEAFGEHGLYLHDASVYDTHLHVPLWVHHPEHAPEVVDDVASTKDLFGLMLGAGLRGSSEGRSSSRVDGRSGNPLPGTILDSSYRARNRAALAEHFHYPHTARVLERFRRNQGAVVTRGRKLIACEGAIEAYELQRDADERFPEALSPGDAGRVLRRAGLSEEAAARAVAHLAGERTASVGRAASSQRIDRRPLASTSSRAA